MAVPTRNYELETPMIELYTWLDILQYAERKKTNLDLKCAFFARWTLPPGTAATPPPPTPQLNLRHCIYLN
jgi:hypothetical protein